MTDITVTRAGNRFEAHVGGKLAGFADFSDAGGVRTFPHTEVDPAFGGQGVGGRLVGGALDATRQDGLAVRPLCSFVAAYIDKHEEYRDLLA